MRDGNAPTNGYTTCACTLHKTNESCHFKLHFRGHGHLWLEYWQKHGNCHCIVFTGKGDGTSRMVSLSSSVRQWMEIAWNEAPESSKTSRRISSGVRNTGRGNPFLRLRRLEALEAAKGTRVPSSPGIGWVF